MHRRLLVSASLALVFVLVFASVAPAGGGVLPKPGKGNAGMPQANAPKVPVNLGGKPNFNAGKTTARLAALWAAAVKQWKPKLARYNLQKPSKSQVQAAAKKAAGVLAGLVQQVKQQAPATQPLKAVNQVKVKAQVQAAVKNARNVMNKAAKKAMKRLKRFLNKACAK